MIAVLEGAQRSLAVTVLKAPVLFSEILFCVVMLKASLFSVAAIGLKEQMKHVNKREARVIDAVCRRGNLGPDFIEFIVECVLMTTSKMSGASIRGSGIDNTA